MNSTILIVADVEHSALSIAALSRARLLDAEVIHALEFITPQRLLKELIVRAPQLILFSWRQALIDILKVCSSEDLKLLRKKATLTILIPDHLGQHAKFQKDESKLLDYVDYYMVTSEILFKEYSKLPGAPKPAGILHDVPDLNLIRQVRAEVSRRNDNQVVWIGNSKWGIHQGLIDHKGFSSIIQPLKSLFERHESCTKIEIIDSATGRKSNIEVLRIIHNSKVLLQTSESEGTGLPILEALGLGVTPITTDVGIASEVLENHKNLIIPRDTASFHSLVHQERLKPTLSETSAIQIFEDFISLISNEILPEDFEKISDGLVWQQTNLMKKIQVIATWILRFLKKNVVRRALPIYDRFA